MNNNKFIRNFRSWLNQQNQESSQDLIGSEVYPKITIKKFCEVVDVVRGNPLITAKCFSHEGGFVENIIDHQALVNCRKGKFYIDIRDIKKS